MPYFGNGFGFGRAKKVGGVSYDALAATYFAAVPNSFDAARKTIINTLIAGLRSDGNLTKLDRLWLFANTTTGNAVIDVIGLNSVTLVNAPTFASDRGYVNDGASNYIKTNFAPATHGVNYTQNSASFGIYYNTLGVASTHDMGIAYDQTHQAHLHCYYSGDVAYYNANANSGQAQATAITTNVGFTSCVRTASNSQSFYRNGVSVDTEAQVTTGLPALDMWIFTHNQNGSPSAYVQCGRAAIAYMGGGTIDQSTLNSRIVTYLTEIGGQ